MARCHRRPHPVAAIRAAFTVTMLAAVLAGTSARAGKDGENPFLPKRSDAAIIAHVAMLEAEPAPDVDAGGHGTTCLGFERILQLRISSHTITENMVYRVDEPEASPAASRRIQLSSTTKVEAAVTWTLRDGAVIRHAADTAMIVPGNDNVPTEIVIAVHDVRPGDVVGWSIRYSRPTTYFGGNLVVADVVPVRFASILVVTDGLIAYRTFGCNLRRDAWSCEILKRDKGVEKIVRWTMHDVGRLDPGPLAAPPLAVVPAVQVSWSGTFNKYRGRWLTIENWNTLALWVDAWFKSMFASDLEVRKVAVRVTDGRTGPLERLDALRAFVREKIVLIEPWEARDSDRSAAEVLRTRNATRLEAGALLYALATELRLNVRPVLARSLEAGPFDEDLRALMQFTDIVVESLDHPGTYFAVAGTPGAIGELPYDLMGARAMFIEPDLDKKEEALDNAAWEAGRSESFERYFEEYRERLEAAHWHTMFTLPGNPNAVQGSVRETVTWAAGTDTLAIELAATGHADRLDLSPGAVTFADGLARYADWRFPGSLCRESVASAVTDTLRGQLVSPAPQAEGDTWSLPAAFVYGSAFLPEWQEPLPDQLYCPATRNSRRVWRMSLPEGWTLASAPRPVSVTNPRLALSAQVAVIDRELVIVREWQWRRGITLRDARLPLDQAVKALREFEQTPLLLIRNASGG
jgi:hypothetical protein